MTEEDRLRLVIHEIKEIWIGSELPSLPRAETAPEAYAQRIAMEMYKAACEILPRLPLRTNVKQ